MSLSRSRLRLLGWLVVAQWRERPGGLLIAALSIAIGITLALGIHLVNRSALAQFASALALINGQAQAQVLGSSGFIDEELFIAIANEPGIAVASPVIELRVQAQPGDTSRSPIAVRLLGIDPLRAARVTPALIARLPEDDERDPARIFADDALFFSRSALRALGLALGDPVTLISGSKQVRLRAAGSLEDTGGEQFLAVADLANVQEYFGLIGRLSRIDLQFDSRTDAGTVRQQIERRLPETAVWSDPESAGLRMSNLSRAYRVNLNVLALVALFTGAFIVQATLALRVIRQQRELALMGVLGAPRRLVDWRVLADALAIGVPGAALGTVAGVLLASLLLRFTGGDLGGGYFGNQNLTVHYDGLSIAVAFSTGILVALAGALPPLKAARSIPAASALRAGHAEAIFARHGGVALPLIGIMLALALSAAPPVYGLPLPSYAAIAILLVSGIALSPRIIAPCARAAARLIEQRRANATLWLATQRLAGAPASAAAVLGGVIASFALASAMAIMVTSFRTSVSGWLDQVLPADVYARSSAGMSGAGLDRPAQEALASLPGVRLTEFSRTVPLIVDARQPPVTLVARPLQASGAETRLPLTGRVFEPPKDSVPVWVTEAMVDLHGWSPGYAARLPLGSSGSAVEVFVAGVWRDYARQHGAITMELSDYQRLTGDFSANEVAWWLTNAESPARFIGKAREISAFTEAMEFRDTAELKAVSLDIFDRSFAITYALEAIAIAVALFGVASAVSGEALSRLREFGMLRHLGLTRRQVGRQFAIEATLGSLIAAVWGLALGATVAWVLVHRVNPQSFHWTMSMHCPWAILMTTGLATVILAALTARLAAREVTGSAPVRAVREDW
jgi:putative ABC transport system permease protein